MPLSSNSLEPILAIADNRLSSLLRARMIIPFTLRCIDEAAFQESLRCAIVHSTVPSETDHRPETKVYPISNIAWFIDSAENSEGSHVHERFTGSHSLVLACRSSMVTSSTAKKPNVAAPPTAQPSELDRLRQEKLDEQIKKLRLENQDLSQPPPAPVNQSIPIWVASRS
jgi:hypothetical protein